MYTYSYIYVCVGLEMGYTPQMTSFVETMVTNRYYIWGYIYNGYIYIYELNWFDMKIINIYKWDFTLFNHPEKFLWLSRNIMNTVKT